MQRPAVRRRIRRRANSASNDPAEQLTEMSVRGLNLFRYASVSEGVYQCTECAKENIQKTFKNKYSFQRHAFLYHEGHQRKVFPCPVCCKEFSRPDKMKNHMKTTHDCYVPKDMVYPPNAFYMLQGIEGQLPPDFHYTFEDDGEHGSMPIITLEVMSDSSNPDPNINYEASYASEVPTDEFTRDNTGVHFLSEKMSEDQQIDEKEETKETPKVRNDLLEYMLRDDGSVICKLCGEILQSRTHWYRHKYKLHVAQTSNPTPLFQCEQCLVYFKSRKGYIGHLASRHSDLLADSSPILTNSQAEAYSKEKANSQTQTILEATDEADPEQAIPKTSVPNYQTTVVKQAPKSTEQKKVYKVYRAKAPEVRPPDYDEKRSREEKLVADIIDRVRRECEAQGGTSTSTRRGYSRRTTAMHT